MVNLIPNFFRQISRYHIAPLYRRLFTLGGAILVLTFMSASLQAQTISDTPESVEISSTSEAIRSFHSQITIQNDGSLRITETLDFFTPTPRHGIYRQIPYRYNRDGWRFTSRISQVKVTSDGKDVPVEQSSDNAFLTLKIGDPDSTFSGPRTYSISYTVEHAILSAANEASQPELYWDITGESWKVPILKTTATIISPNKITDSECFSGAYGFNNELCTLSLPNNRTATVEYDEDVFYGDNVTVRLSLDPAGPVVAPTQTQKLGWWISDHWPLALTFVPPIIMLWFYSRRGRDWWYGGSLHTPNVAGAQKQYWPWSLPALPMIYEPPVDLTPGEASVLIHERVLPTAVVAEILELAHLKYLTVERRAKNKYWFVQQTSHNKKKTLSKAQQAILDGLFAGRTEVSIETLKGTFYTTVQKVQQYIEETLVEKKLVSGKPSMVRGIWIAGGLGFVGVTAGIVLGILSPFVPVWFWFLEILAVAICFGCGWAMPHRTAAGSNAAWKMKGLRQTIQRGAWREKIKEKHLFIEEVLPFAVAFGVVKQLTRDLKDLQLEPPEYVDALVTNGVISNSLVNSFSSSTTSSFAPPSSSSSGWSGGGSGGGGGGGGGGSW